MEIRDRELFDRLVGPSSDEDFLDYVEACRGYGITGYSLYETIMLDRIEGEPYNKDKDE